MKKRKKVDPAIAARNTTNLRNARQKKEILIRYIYLKLVDQIEWDLNFNDEAGNRS